MTSPTPPAEREPILECLLDEYGMQSMKMGTADSGSDEFMDGVVGAANAVDAIRQHVTALRSERDRLLGERDALAKLHTQYAPMNARRRQVADDAHLPDVWIGITGLPTSTSDDPGESTVSANEWAAGLTTKMLAITGRITKDRAYKTVTINEEDLVELIQIAREATAKAVASTPSSESPR